MRIVLQGYNSTFTILSGKNNQSAALPETTESKSALPNEDNVPSKELDDEIPF